MRYTTALPVSLEVSVIKQIQFQRLDDVALPFPYDALGDGTCLVRECEPGIETAEINEHIKIIRTINTPRFSGGPEPIRVDGILRFVQYDGERGLETKEFGEWQCIRCHHIQLVQIEKGKIYEPFECENDVCKRKTGFKPLFPKELVRPIWPLPGPYIECPGWGIYIDVLDFCKKYLILEDREYYVMALWIMATWLSEDFKTAPYLTFIAPKSSGKTAALNVLHELAYRAISTVSVTAAALFRCIDLWHVTLLIDEAEYQVRADTESGQALYGCLNGGYKRGSYALRTEGDANCRVPAAFELFGFKAIASTKLFLPTLESRSIIFNMRQATPKEIIIDEEEARTIRSKLLYWRYETLGKLPNVQPDSKIGRIVEMLTPLYTVAQILKYSKDAKVPITYEGLSILLNNLIEDMQEQRKQEEQDSAEGQVLKVVKDLIEKDAQYELFIRIKDVANDLIAGFEWEEVPGKQKISARVGQILKTMGILTTRQKYGMILNYEESRNAKRLNELYKRFLRDED